MIILFHLLQSDSVSLLLLIPISDRMFVTFNLLLHNCILNLQNINRNKPLTQLVTNLKDNLKGPS